MSCIEVVGVLLIEFLSYAFCYKILFNVEFETKPYKYMLSVVIITIGTFASLTLWNEYDGFHLVDFLLPVLIPTFLIKDKKLVDFLLFPVVQGIEGGVHLVLYFFTIDTNHILIGEKGQDPNMETSALCVCLFVFAMLIVLKVRNRNTRIEITWKQYFCLIIIYVSSIFAIGSALNMEPQTDSDIYHCNMITLGLQMVFFVMYYIIFWIGVLEKERIENKYKVFLAESIMEEQRKHIETVINGDRETRKFRHNIKSHLLELKALSEKSGNTDIINYCNSFIKDAGISEMYIFTGNIPIDAVINHYSNIASKNDIKMESNVFFEDNGKINIYDVCTVISNMLQNAIEACEKIQENKIVEFHMYPMEDTLYISTKNPICNDESLYYINSEISSKWDRLDHGYGLMSIKDVVNKYEGKFEYRVENDFLIMTIIL